jgi:hypothetical protein
MSLGAKGLSSVASDGCVAPSQ